MEKHDVVHLENKIQELSDSLTGLAAEKGFKDLAALIHKPGFTSVAESFLLTGVVGSMIEQAKVLSGLKQVLFDAAARVELNPQPLPPGAFISLASD